METTIVDRPPPSSLRVERATCLALFAFDVAPYIDLQDCEQRIASATHRQKITKRRRALEYFEYRPAPLVISLKADPISVGEHPTQPAAEVVIYDFGAVTVTYAIPFAGSLLDLIGLAGDIHDNESLPDEARRLVAALGGVLTGGRGAPAIADIVEDYVIFHVAQFADAIDPTDLLTTYSSPVARILRAESESISEQEARDAVALNIAFGKWDLAVLDWNAVLLYGREVDDLRTVIEFANVQLLEMRFLDRQLDAALEESYALLSQRGENWRAKLRSYRRDVRKIARLQVDGAILFERVSNALKVFGEEYLSRVYGLTARRLQLAAWDASALRKLGTLESIYQKLTDEASARRLEILEWIIVILIAVSIALPFIFIT
ncbi:MAG: hypothetical protein PVI01_09885 [Gemmatimonadales bacterium]|jgi:hypothetical protein